MNRTHSKRFPVKWSTLDRSFWSSSLFHFEISKIWKWWKQCVLKYFSYQNLVQGKSLHQIPKSFVLREWTNRKYLQEARYRSYGRKDRYHFCWIFKRNIINNEKFRYNLVKFHKIVSNRPDNSSFGSFQYIFSKNKCPQQAQN